jgi:hypothetical protein
MDYNLHLDWKEELLEQSRDLANCNENSEVGARTRRGNFWKRIMQRRNTAVPNNWKGVSGRTPTKLYHDIHTTKILQEGVT